MKTIYLAAAMAISLGMSSASSIADEKTNTGGGKVEAGAVMEAKVAADLAAMGRTAKDPIMLITAARIQATIGGEEASRDKREEGGTDSSKAEGEKSSVASLLAEASALAGDNQVIAALIADVESMGTKGRTHGSARTWERVRAGATDWYDIEYRGDRSAEILIEGDGDTDLDLYVYDEHGNEICRDTDSTDTMYCSWHPRWTGNFEIAIVNLGSVWNEYLLRTN